jgi:hypothetical protein
MVTDNCVVEVLEDGTLIPYFDTFTEEEAARFIDRWDFFDRNFFLATLTLAPLQEDNPQ